MDQEKIGKFIAKCRKENNLTQNELGEKLNVTYKAYKTYGWQVTSGTEKAKKEAIFVTKFLDIYENSFNQK